MKVVIFHGYSGSGKTHAISCLVRALKRRRKVVGVLKHIHSGNFTIDPKGKDTRAFAESGSTTVVTVSTAQILIIEKTSTDQMDVKRILEIFRRRSTDYLFVEGWHRKFERLQGVKRVLCASSSSELRVLMKEHPRTLFIIARFASLKKRREIENYHVPVLVLPKDVKHALSLIT